MCVTVECCVKLYSYTNLSSEVKMRNWKLVARYLTEEDKVSDHHKIISKETCKYFQYVTSKFCYFGAKRANLENGYGRFYYYTARGAYYEKMWCFIALSRDGYISVLSY